MPGDTYTPSQPEKATVFSDGNVLEFHMAREGLKSTSELQAEREVAAAYQNPVRSAEVQRTPEQEAARMLTNLTIVRRHAMGLADAPDDSERMPHAA